MDIYYIYLFFQRKYKDLHILKLKILFLIKISAIAMHCLDICKRSTPKLIMLIYFSD